MVTRHDDEPPVKISRTTSQNVLSGVLTAMILAMVSGIFLMRDSLRDLTVSNAAFVVIQAKLVEGQARIEAQIATDRSEKIIIDQRQDFEIGDHEKRLGKLEHRR